MIAPDNVPTICIIYWRQVVAPTTTIHEPGTNERELDLLAVTHTRCIFVLDIEGIQ